MSTLLEVVDTTLAEIGQVVLDALLPILGLRVRLYNPIMEDNIYSSGQSKPNYESTPYDESLLIISGILSKDHARNHQANTSSSDSPTTETEKKAWGLDYIPRGTKVVARLYNKEIHMRVQSVYQDPTRLGSYYEFILEPL